MLPTTHQHIEQFNMLDLSKLSPFSSVATPFFQKLEEGYLRDAADILKSEFTQTPAMASLCIKLSDAYAQANLYCEALEWLSKAGECLPTSSALEEKKKNYLRAHYGQIKLFLNIQGMTYNLLESRDALGLRLPGNIVDLPEDCKVGRTNTGQMVAIFDPVSKTTLEELSKAVSLIKCEQEKLFWTDFKQTMLNEAKSGGDWICMQSNHTKLWIGTKDIALSEQASKVIIDGHGKYYIDFQNAPPTFLEALSRVFIAFLQEKIETESITLFTHYLGFLMKKPLGHLPREIASAILAQPYVPKDENDDGLRPEVYLRAKCDQYAKAHSSEKSRLLTEIEEWIMQVKNENFSPLGIDIPYQDDGTFISVLKTVYAYGDKALIDLFARYLPILKIHHYSKDIPSFIVQNEEMVNKNIESFLNRNNSVDYPQLEQTIKKVQRAFRSRKRKWEESNRIPQFYRTYGVDHLTPTSFLYIPRKCSVELRQRIVDMACQTKFLRFLSHETQISSLVSIFNDSLYGRRTLQQHKWAHGISFIPAALGEVDIEYGDGNTICLGNAEGEIDPAVDSTTIFLFDRDKMDFQFGKKAHNVFFKQIDFAFTGKINHQHISLNKFKKLTFKLAPSERDGHVRFELTYEENGEKHHLQANVPNIKLLSYNFAQIEAALILNFFYLLDNLQPVKEVILKERTLVKGNGEMAPFIPVPIKRVEINLHPSEEEKSQAEQIIAAVYYAIGQMNAKELQKFLRNVGNKLTKAMEFNFYGSYQIDFDSLMGVVDKRSNTVLDINALKEIVKTGKVDALNRLVKAFPEVFASFRFIDYLSTKTDQENMLNTLGELRLLCKQPPGWYPENEKFRTMQNRKSPDSDHLSRTLDDKKTTIKPK